MEPLHELVGDLRRQFKSGFRNAAEAFGGGDR
jgi:hypothetical protein